MNIAQRLLVLALSGASFAFAQQGAPATPDVPDTLDLKTAITYALDHNFSILQARERIREQEGLIIEVKARILPNVSLDSSYSKNADELSSDRGGSGGGASTQDWSIALNARQALYTGGSVKGALDAQKLVRESALLELQGVINAALLDVRVRFYDVLLTREQIGVQEENVRLLREQLSTAKNRFEAGASSNFEVLRAEVALANAQPALIRARNAYRNSIDALRQSLGYINTRDGSVRKIPEFVGTLEFTPVNYDLVQSLETARTSRPDLLRLSKLEDARTVGVRVQQAGYYPTVDLVGGYQYRKNGNSERFGQSLDGWTVGLQSSWAIFDGRATKGRVVQARSQLEQARLLTAEATLSVEVQVRRAISSLQEAAELAEAAVRVVAQAEESLRLADVRYSAGTATQLDVLQSRVDLTTARDNQLQANYSYNVALATLRQAIGQADTFVATP